MDWIASAADCESEDNITVVEGTINPSLSSILMQQIDHLALCDDYGIGFFVQAVDIALTN